MEEKKIQEAIGLVISYHQSKRAKLKKQVTHWYGKFMIVKAENNRLRNINKKLVKDNSDLKDRVGEFWHGA